MIGILCFILVSCGERVLQNDIIKMSVDMFIASKCFANKGKT